MKIRLLHRNSLAGQGIDIHWVTEVLIQVARQAYFSFTTIMLKAGTDSTNHIKTTIGPTSYILTDGLLKCYCLYLAGEFCLIIIQIICIN